MDALDGIGMLCEVIH